MKTFARNRITMIKTVSLTEFKHPPHRLLPARRHCFRWHWRGLLLNDALEVIPQGHPSGLRFGQKSRFDLRSEGQYYSHGILRFPSSVYGRFMAIGQYKPDACHNVDGAGNFMPRATRARDCNTARK